MDDYSISTLIESKNEWSARLVTVFTPCIIEGFKSIFNEALKLCIENNEEDKYLMTFQNFLSRIPKWNPDIINLEKDRIIQRSGCNYIEDLITCVHIIQLKALTCSRVGIQQKKVDINIPSVTDFVHKLYINTARKLYTNIYLFEKDILPLLIQKNNRELELIIKEIILITIRDNIPIENILRAYLDETEEIDTRIEEKQEFIPVTDEEKEEENKDKKEEKKEDNEEKKEKNEVNEGKKEKNEVNEGKTQNLKFSDIDIALTETGKEEKINAPKDIDTLEQIAKLNNEKRKEEEAAEDDEETLVIGENISLDIDTINDLNIKPKSQNEILLSDIEVL